MAVTVNVEPDCVTVIESLPDVPTICSALKPTIASVVTDMPGSVCAAAVAALSAAVIASPAEFQLGSVGDAERSSRFFVDRG